MSITDFANLLESLGLPVACNRFNEPQKPPFLIYLDTSSDNFGADNIVFHESINVDIELYSETINDELENRIKQLLTENGIYYDWVRTWIESEKIYQTNYEVSL